MKYTIKEAAERTKISAHVLRYYEKEGILPRVDRTRSGSRRYSESDLDLISLIICLKKTGMPLREIKTFVQLQNQGPDTLDRRCQILEEQKQSILRHIEEMKKSCEKVEHKLTVYKNLLMEYKNSEKI